MLFYKIIPDNDPGEYIPGIIAGFTETKGRAFPFICDGP
jgi:hypothetical protein